jgi:DNA ligase-1
MTISKFQQLISICQNTTGDGSRKIIKQSISELDETGKKLCYLALNPYITFGVKQIPVVDLPSLEDGDLSHFFTLCDKLSSREVTGNAAKLAIVSCLEMYTGTTIELLSSVLRKNLQATFNVKTYNSAVSKADAIPVFNVMLADKCETDEEYDNLVENGILADYKYDGVRTITIVENQSIKFYSREGIEMIHCDGLFDSDLRKIQQRYGDFVLDSEQFNSSWEETMNSRKSGDSAAKQGLHLLAFFIMPIEDWYNQHTEITMEANRANLIALCTELNLVKISPSAAVEVKTVQEIKDLLKKVTTPGFNKQPKGYEGLILKRKDAPYQWKRVLDWCKVKNFYDIDVMVTEVLPGRPNTKYSSVMGKVRVKGYTESGVLVEGYIGSGFSDAQRKMFFENPELIVGKTIVCSYQEITKPSAKQPVPNLRFGTFVRFHDSKILTLDDFE